MWKCVHGAVALAQGHVCPETSAPRAGPAAACESPGQQVGAHVDMVGTPRSCVDTVTASGVEVWGVNLCHFRLCSPSTQLHQPGSVLTWQGSLRSACPRRSARVRHLLDGVRGQDQVRGHCSPCRESLGSRDSVLFVSRGGGHTVGWGHTPAVDSRPGSLTWPSWVTGVLPGRPETSILEKEPRPGLLLSQACLPKPDGLFSVHTVWEACRGDTPEAGASPRSCPTPCGARRPLLYTWHWPGIGRALCRWGLGPRCHLPMEPPQPRHSKRGP